MSAEQALLELAEEAARLGGGLLTARAARGGEASVASKSTPTDLVSEADLASQRAIRELLAQRRPGDGFLGEEEDANVPGESGLRWIVDPLDGTVNYLFGIPQWAVSVAVADREGALAGAVYDPSRDELFAATRGGPAVLEAGSARTELRPPGGESHSAGAGDGLAGAMVATGLAYDAKLRERQAQVLARVIPRVRDIRRFGSAALDLCWTAAGRYDAYYERSVKTWDVAAGELICRRAGLEVHRLEAVDALPWGILAGRAGVAQDLLGLVSRG